MTCFVSCLTSSYSIFNCSTSSELICSKVATSVTHNAYCTFSLFGWIISVAFYASICSVATWYIHCCYCVHSQSACCCNILKSISLLMFSIGGNFFNSFFILLKFSSVVWNCYVTRSIYVSSIKASHDCELCSYFLVESSSPSWIFCAVFFTAFGPAFNTLSRICTRSRLYFKFYNSFAEFPTTSPTQNIIAFGSMLFVIPMP